MKRKRKSKEVPLKHLRVKKYGASFYIPLTRQLKAINIKEGDHVDVSVIPKKHITIKKSRKQLKY